MFSDSYLHRPHTCRSVHTSPCYPQKRRTDSVDSGVFSQQSSLENSEVSSESGSLQLTCTPTATGSDEPLEDYTKYNASLPPVPPTKVPCAHIHCVCMFVLYCSWLVESYSWAMCSVSQCIRKSALFFLYKIRHNCGLCTYSHMCDFIHNI